MITVKERLVGICHAFIRFTRDFLLGTVTEFLPRNQVVPEILEDVNLDKESLD